MVDESPPGGEQSSHLPHQEPNLLGRSMMPVEPHEDDIECALGRDSREVPRASLQEIGGDDVAGKRHVARQGDLLGVDVDTGVIEPELRMSLESSPRNDRIPSTGEIEEPQRITAGGFFVTIDQMLTVVRR